MTVQASDWPYQPPQRWESLAEQVHQQLRGALQAGAYAPLERISVRKLAKELGVSVTPVREAALRLVSDDVLQADEKKALFVPYRSKSEMSEIFEVRQWLEGELAARAAAKLSDEEVSYLEKTHALYLQALAAEDYKEALRANSSFHFCIYQRGDSPIRLKIVEDLWLKIGPTLRHMYPLLTRERGPSQHESIVEAARMRSPDKLRVAVISDLEISEDVLNRFHAEYKNSINGLTSSTAHF